MATITAAQNERVFQIKEWLGLHESADGDTNLKLGEGSVCRNFRITNDRKLKKRPGTELMFTPPDTDWGRCGGIWAGTLGGVEMVLGIFGSCLYRLWSSVSVGGYNEEEWRAEKIADLPNGGGRLMFPFNGKLYIRGAGFFYKYDGQTLDTATPYVPLVEVALSPLGSGTLLEQVNRLSNKRRVWLSPDGTASTFQLPESDLASIDYAKANSNGAQYAFTSDTAAGTITFNNTPAQGVNTIEVCYTVPQPVLPIDDPGPNAQTCVELYNGDQNNRVFLYGRGNKAYYSGINYSGEPDATYFPDLNVISVGDAGDTITGMIRYNSRLLCFTEKSTYTIQYGQFTEADGNVIAAFYLTPVHKSVGNKKDAQVQLVMNSPVSIHEGIAYSWTGNSYGNMTADERQVKRISDRVYATLQSFAEVECFDDNARSEYYIICKAQKKALVWNYAADAWYLYDGVYIDYPFTLSGDMYFASGNYWEGETPCVCRFAEDVPYDEEADGTRAAIDCYWESGNMSFGADYQRKYSAMLWVGVKPAHHANVWATVKTDRSGEMTEKVIGHSWASFADANFAAWSFNTSHRPKLKRLKIKAKKFVYYKLIFFTNTNDSTATVTAADIRVRFTGYAK